MAGKLPNWEVRLPGAGEYLRSPFAGAEKATTRNVAAQKALTTRSAFSPALHERHSKDLKGSGRDLNDSVDLSLQLGHSIPEHLKRQRGSGLPGSVQRPRNPVLK